MPTGAEPGPDGEVSALADAQAAVLALLEAGELERAREEGRRLARVFPFEAAPYYLQGVALARQGLHEAAHTAFVHALRLKPDHVDTSVRAVRALIALGRGEGALDLARRTVAQAPDSHRAMRSLAFAEQNAGRPGQALRHFRAALRLRPDDIASLVGAAATMVAAHRPARALALARRATRVAPDRAAAWMVLGDAWVEAGDLVRAEEAQRRAVAVEPDHAEAHNTLGRMLGNAGRFEEAQACFRRALELRPDYVEATWNLSLNALRTGDFEEGWRTYEVRWKRKEAAGHPTFLQPPWLGDEPLDGRTILLHGEQGIGDTIQFLRYLPHACALGSPVLLGLQNNAEALAGCLRTEARIVLNRTRLPPFDVHAPLGSLPLALRHTVEGIPAEVPYLFPAEERLATWRSRLDAATGGSGRPRIGLAWSGDPKHPNDHNRSLPFRAFIGLFQDIDADLVVLQRPIRESDREEVAASPVHDLAAGSGDMHDAAALASLMDLVVSVDTSIAHLAGALARPVWVLLPFAGDWRWLTGREDSPWYPTMRLFRQPELRAWAPVFGRVRSALRERFPGRP